MDPTGFKTFSGAIARIPFVKSVIVLAEGPAPSVSRRSNTAGADALLQTLRSTVLRLICRKAPDTARHLLFICLVKPLSNEPLNPRIDNPPSRSL